MTEAQPLKHFNRLLSWSLFGSAKDNTPERRDGSWGELVKILTKVNPKPRHSDLAAAKKAVPAFASATFFEGTKRSLEAVEMMHLLPLDFDNSKDEPVPGEIHKGSGRPVLRKVRIENPVRPEEVVEALNELGLAAVVYTTWSNSPDHPKFRVVLPLQSPIAPAYWTQATEWALEFMKFDRWKDSKAIDLPVLRDTARLNFLPCAPDPSTVRTWVVEGRHLNIPANLLPQLTIAEPEPEPWVERRPRTNPRTGKDWWNDYKIDFKTLNIEGLMVAMGVKVGKAQPWHHGFKWRCHCPWANEHTNQVDDDSAVIIRTLGDWPSFKCQHSGHQLLGLREICEAAGAPLVESRGEAYRQEPEPPEDDPDDPGPTEPPIAARDPHHAPAWDRLAKDKKGGAKRTAGNLAKILRFDPHWGARLGLNLMSQDVTLDRKPVTGAFMDQVQEWVEDHYGLSFGLEVVQSKVYAQAQENPYHPVKEYLEGLKWDGRERFQQVVDEVLHAEPHPLNIQYLRRWAISAVRRALYPGCKVDTTLNLVGPQGAQKSTFFAVLGGEWFGDSHIDIQNKDGLMVLHRSWIHELGEIDGVTRKADAERLKAFITSRKDIFRPPFGRVTGEFPRSGVIVGTTNEANFLVDPTGSRRFWIMRIMGAINTQLLSELRDQFWAEAVELERQGVPHWLEESMEVLREERAAEFESVDPWTGQINEYMAKALPLRPEGVSISDILEDLKVPIAQSNRGVSMRVASILRREGYVPKLSGPKRVSRWFAGSGESPLGLMGSLT